MVAAPFAHWLLLITLGPYSFPYHGYADGGEMRHPLHAYYRSFKGCEGAIRKFRNDVAAEAEREGIVDPDDFDFDCVPSSMLSVTK
jgi:hypothetical protein